MHSFSLSLNRLHTQPLAFKQRLWQGEQRTIAAECVAHVAFGCVCGTRWNCALDVTCLSVRCYDWLANRNRSVS